MKNIIKELHCLFRIYTRRFLFNFECQHYWISRILIEAWLFWSIPSYTKWVNCQWLCSKRQFLFVWANKHRFSFRHISNLQKEIQSLLFLFSCLLWWSLVSSLIFLNLDYILSLFTNFQQHHFVQKAIMVLFIYSPFAQWIFGTEPPHTAASGIFWRVIIAIANYSLDWVVIC